MSLLAHVASHLAVAGLATTVTAALVSSYLSPSRRRDRAVDAADAQAIAASRAKFAPNLPAVVEAQPVPLSQQVQDWLLKAAFALGRIWGRLSRAAYEPPPKPVAVPVETDLYTGRHRHDPAEPQYGPGADLIDELMEVAR